MGRGEVVRREQLIDLFFLYLHIFFFSFLLLVEREQVQEVLNNISTNTSFIRLEEDAQATLELLRDFDQQEGSTLTIPFLLLSLLVSPLLTSPPALPLLLSLLLLFSCYYLLIYYEGWKLAHDKDDIKTWYRHEPGNPIHSIKMEGIHLASLFISLSLSFFFFFLSFLSSFLLPPYHSSHPFLTNYM